MLRKLPKEFGGRGAFPSLEIFSLVFLSGLEELPVVEEDSMPLLHIFTITICPELKILPESYLNLKALKKLRIYDNSELIHFFKNHKTNEKIRVVTISEANTERAIEALKNYMCNLRVESSGSVVYGTDSWRSEIFQFLFSFSCKDSPVSPNFL